MNEAVMRQMRVVGALMLRDTLVRYGKTQIGYAWAVLEPAAFVAVLSVAFGVIGADAPFGPSKAMFFATGLLPFYVYRKLATGLTFNLTRSMTIYPQVRPIDGILARAFLELGTMIVVMIIIYSTMTLAIGFPAPHNLPAMMTAILAIFFVGLGMGLTNGIILKLFPSWKNFMDLTNRPMIFISGVFFLPDRLPKSVQEYLYWNPVLHGMELFRSGYYLNYPTSVLNVNYLLGCAMFLCLIGFAGERAFRPLLDKAD